MDIHIPVFIIRFIIIGVFGVFCVGLGSWAESKTAKDSEIGSCVLFLFIVLIFIAAFLK